MNCSVLSATRMAQWTSLISFYWPWNATWSPTSMDLTFSTLPLKKQPTVISMKPKFWQEIQMLKELKVMKKLNTAPSQFLLIRTSSLLFQCLQKLFMAMKRTLSKQCLIKCWSTRSSIRLKDWLAAEHQKWELIPLKFYLKNLFACISTITINSSYCSRSTTIRTLMTGLKKWFHGKQLKIRTK